MKIVTYLLAALLAAALGAAAFFYFTTFEPMQAEYVRMKPEMAGLERANVELKKYKKKEAEETGWIGPAIAVLNAALSDEVKAGTVEISNTGNTVVVNIAEQVLYTPRSVTFAKESPQFRANLAGALRAPQMKGKQITIANTTDPVPAQGKGRRRTPPRDARTLAAGRSVALAKSLEQYVDQNLLVAAAYSSTVPDTGFRIKDHKTVIVIRNPPAPQQPKTAGSIPPAATKPSVTTQPSTTGTPKQNPSVIPFKPIPPKGQ